VICELELLVRDMQGYNEMQGHTVNPDSHKGVSKKPIYVKIKLTDE
jgi:hypothetical protein